MRHREYKLGTKPLAVLGVLVILGGASGCGDDDSGSGPIPLNEVQSTYMRSYCQLAIDCEFDPYVSFFNGEVDICVEFLESSGEVDTALQTLVDSVNAGNTSYDPDLARECFDAMQAMTCAEAYDDTTPVAACDETFVGLLANGTDCTLDEECTGGWCDMTLSCPGVCADVVLVGGDCSMGQTCESGALCEMGQCILDPGPLQLGNDCVESYRDCAYGLWCDWDGNGVCENRVGVGQNCEGQDQCEHGLFCGAEGQCAVVEIVENVGDPCGGYDEGPFCDLAAGLGCQAEYAMDVIDFTVCVEMLPAGGSCLEQDAITEVVTVTPCDTFAGLYCDMDLQNFTGVCVAKKAGGQQCDDGDECQSDYCQMDGTCAPVIDDPCD